MTKAQLIKRVEELYHANTRLLYKATMMQIQLRTLATDINSEASKSILAKIRRQILIEKENKLSNEN